MVKLAPGPVYKPESLQPLALRLYIGGAWHFTDYEFYEVRSFNDKAVGDEHSGSRGSVGHWFLDNAKVRIYLQSPIAERNPQPLEVSL
jgi:hypothetical protein